MSGDDSAGGSNPKPLPFRGGVGEGQSVATDTVLRGKRLPHPNPVRPVLGRPGDDLGRTPEGEGLFPNLWPKPLLVTALAIAAILAIFAPDVADMAALWWNISTYQHCLYVLPIVAWLLWMRRSEVAQVEPAGWPCGLLFVLGAGLVWLMGEAGGVAIVRHFGVILLIQSSILAILGPAVVRAILFPLFYLVFLVPFGDEFVGPMQTLTAKMTMGLLHLSGVPATIDGVFITTRAGWFEVAEACAGVKFLVAMIAYGALAANVCFRSPVRRAVFMIAAIVVPVLANGVRAWATIFAAEFVGVKAASGFDHIVYGWVFFAVVMLVVMAAAWPFFDRKIGENWLGGKVFAPWKPTAAVIAMAPLAVAVAALPVGWDGYAARAGRVALPAAVSLPTVPGWTRVADVPTTPWTPRFDGADHVLIGRYGNADGQRVDVGVALYGWQDHGREIVAFGQGAANADQKWAWATDLPRLGSAKVERLLGPDKAVREAATWWFVGGKATPGKAAVKIATLKARLTGGDQSAATLIVSAEGSGAHDAITAFVRAMGDPQPRVAVMLAQAQGQTKGR